MRSLILGTAGHIDHGKTTLVRALTGVDTDRLAEEKRRGITIDLGFAHLRLAPGLEVGIVDVPGHEAFIRNMLAGATGVDLALLVVAADEGIMPQTREHLAILELLGVRGGVVAVTKSDLVEDEWLELVLADIEDSLRGTPFEAVPVVPVSAATGEGLDALREALSAAARTGTARRDQDHFRLPIDRVFPVHGTGTVTTGTIWSGSIARDQTVRLLPSGLGARVRAIQVHGADVDGAAAGQRAALGLVGIDRDRIRRGDILVTDPAWEPTTVLTVRLRLLDSAYAPLRMRSRIRFHLGTTAVLARVVLLDTSELEPGAEGWAQLRLEAPVVARAGDRFVIRSYSPVTTIGGGEVAEPLPERRRRRTAEEFARLEALLTGTPVAGLTALTAAATWRGAPVARLSIDTRFTPGEIAAALEEKEGTTVVRIGGSLFAPAMVTAGRELILEAIDAYHTRYPLRRGIERAELRRTLPPQAPTTLGDWILGQLEAEGTVTAEGPHVRRAGFRHNLDPEQRRIRDLLRNLLEDAGLSPPPLPSLPEEIRALPDYRQLLRILEEEGSVVALSPELYISRASRDHAIAESRRLLAGRGPLAAADFREAIPVSRKHLIPILEHFDAIGITRRTGDLRIIIG